MSTTRTGVYRTIDIAAAAMTPKATNGAQVNTIELSTNKVNLDVLDFDSSSAEGAQFIVTMPREWNASTVKAKFTWTASSGSGGVTWTLSGKAIADDDALDTTQGTAQSVDDTLLATSDLHLTAASSAITIGGTPAAGRAVLFELKRDPANANDTLAADARLIKVTIQYLESSTEPSSW